MNAKIIIIAVSFITSVSCSKIPRSRKKCDRKDGDFQECLRVAVEDALSKSRTPVKEMSLPQLDPMEVPSLVIGAGTGAVAFQQKFKNMKMKGFSDVKCAKVNMDFDAKIMTLICKCPLARLEFEYEVEGKIMILPIRGKGPGSIDLVDLNVEATFNFEEYQKRGKTHFKISSKKTVLTPRLIRFQLDNLFDGDKVLGDNINRVINDNWSDVFADVKSGYEDGFGQIFASVFTSVLDRVPVSDLFGDA